MESNETNALRIATLISKYRLETLTEAEEIELNKWLVRDPENSKLLAQINDEKYVTRSLEDIARFNADKAFERIKRRIDMPAKKNATLRALYIKIGSIAASIILITLLFLNRDRISDILHPVRYEHMATLRGERKTVKLSDGTEIWLSPASALTYPDHFTGKTRDITLTGEAFLEVAKDHAHPFTVHTGKITTTVLGTSFDLKAYPEEKNITVTLLTGKVSFSNGKQEAIILPNQRAIYQKTDKRIIKQDYPAAQSMLARRDGNFQYNTVPVSEVIADLRRNYNMNIVVTDNTGECDFFGRLNNGEDADTFMRKLCMVIGANLTKNGNTYIISGGSCQ
ncbi:MAG: FecR family protein [Flavipsychrobacter sp.]